MIAKLEEILRALNMSDTLEHEMGSVMVELMAVVARGRQASYSYLILGLVSGKEGLRGHSPGLKPSRQAAAG